MLCLSVRVALLVPVAYLLLFVLFFFNDPAPPEIYTLSLHDALPISGPCKCRIRGPSPTLSRSERYPRPLWSGVSLAAAQGRRSEEHTSELQSLTNLVCRLLLEKKKKKNKEQHNIQKDD